MINWLSDLYSTNPAAQAIALISIVCLVGMLLGSVKVCGVSYGVVVTRVKRADLEMTAVPELRLHFGDVVHGVGELEGLSRTAEMLGDSLKALNETHFVPLFAGVVLAVALGTLPIVVPGLTQPFTLGIAAGSLIVSMLIGRLGCVGPLVAHMPFNANLALCELGIALFFASVGLMADPPALSFATKLCGSDAPMTWYAAVFRFRPCCEF